MTKTFRKLLSLIPCLMLVLTCCAVGLSTVYAETTMTGDGSMENPYHITTYAQLQEFSSIVNDGDTDACAVLMEDIIVASDETGFTPIGTLDNGYSGNFDGQNHKIDGISLNSTYHSGLGENFVSLFSKIGKDGRLRNLVLSNVNINDVPTLCGIFVLDNEGGVVNCVLSGNITLGHFAKSYTNFAAIANRNYGKISGCINKCDIDTGSKTAYISGIARENDGIILDCCNFGNLSGVEAYGICMDNSNTVTRCVNFGDITADCAAGLIDSLGSGECGVSECYNTGKITGSNFAKALISSYGSATFNKIYYDSETSGCTDIYATGKKTAELKGNGVVEALNFSKDEWTEQDNDYPLPTTVYEKLNMLFTKLTSDMVSDIPALTYSSAELEPAVIVTDGDETLVEGEDYSVAYRNNYDAGSATVTVNGIGYYYGEVIKEFTIKKRSVTIISGSASKAYDGSPLTNDNISISGDGFANDEGAIYKFTGSQTNAGVSDNTFTYELNGNTDENNYDIKVEFGTLTVNPKALNASMISGVDNATYTGKPIERNIVVKDGDKTLTEITDYTVSYNNNTNAGTDATVTITGKGNYCGEVTKTFTISPASQSTPTDITSTDETKCSASDGTISGLSTDMEIAYERGEYTPCISETMTGLAPGTYSIRYAEKANYVASDSVQVVIKEGDCYGGTATCINKAVCDGCHNEYGELGDHEWNDSYTVDKEPTITEAGSESIHCKLCSATKDSKAILSLTDSHEEYKQASVEKLDSLNAEHDSVISKIIVRFADFVIERCGYDETKSYEENTAVIDKIVEEATDMINTRHYLIYGCPFLSFIANKLEPCFVAVRCFVKFVIVQIKNVF